MSQLMSKQEAEKRYAEKMSNDVGECIRTPSITDALILFRDVLQKQQVELTVIDGSLTGPKPENSNKSPLPPGLLGLMEHIHQLLQENGNLVNSISRSVGGN